MESDDCENTAVFQVNEALADLMRPNTGVVRSRLSFSRNEASMADTNRSSISAVSMQQLMDTERRNKERSIELIQAKASISELKGKVNSLETARKRDRVDFERDLEGCKLDSQKYSDEAERLKNQLNLFLARLDEQEPQLKQVRSELISTKTTYERRVLALQNDKLQLETNLLQMEQDSRNSQLELKNNILRKESELQICNLELDENKTQLQNTLRRLTDANSKVRELEESQMKLLNAEQKVKELENKLSQMDADAVIARTMKEQLDRLRTLEKDNRKLSSENTYWKETQENAFLLREETESLKRKLERTEQRCLDYNQLKLEHQDMKKRLSEWEELSTGSSRHVSPPELSRQISDLQTSNASILELQGHLQANVHTLEGRYAVAEQQLKQTKEKLGQEEVKGQQMTQFLKRLKKKHLLVSMERDTYKNILDTFENETTANVASPSMNHLKRLQETIAGAQRHIEALESQLEHTESELSQAQSRGKLLESQIRSGRQARPPSESQGDGPVVLQLREQVANLEKRLEEEQMRSQELQDRLDRYNCEGGYDTALTKVLHFRANPMTLAQKRKAEEVSTLHEENKKLKTRVEFLEKDEGRFEDITQKVDAKLEEPTSSKELENLEGKVKAAELKNQRLMEVFKKKSQELREAVYQLLGFSLHLPCDNQYKLMNMYAESPSDYLIFQQDPNGQFQLLGTDYSSTLEEKMDVYLTSGNSIPAFLSSVTMDLFSKQTVLQ